MAQASASTCKAAGNDTISIVTGYSKNRTSDQWSRESQHHAQAEEDKDPSCWFNWFPWLRSLILTTEPKKRPDRFDRLSLQCAGYTEPGVVNIPTNKLDQKHLHTCASCDESSLGSCPHRANIFKCPGIKATNEKTDLYIKNNLHDFLIDPDTQRLSLASSLLATKTARVWEICERRALHPEQILVENTRSLIRKTV